MPSGPQGLDDLLARARAFIDHADVQAPVWVGGDGIDSATAGRHADGAALWAVRGRAA